MTSVLAPTVLRSVRQHGYVLPEVMVAFGVLMVTLSAAFQVNSQIARNVRLQRETAAANRALVELVERVRAAAFAKTTDATYLQNSVLNTDPSSAATLPGLAVRLTVSAYPADSSTPIQLTRQNSAVTLNSTNTNLASGTSVRADARVTWTGAGGRSHTRETSIIVAKGGIGS